MPPLPPSRRSVARRRRLAAERLEPPKATVPLVRFDGRWWQRDELLDARRAPEPATGAASPGTYLALFAFMWLEGLVTALVSRARRR